MSSLTLMSNLKMQSVLITAEGRSFSIPIWELIDTLHEAYNVSRYTELCDAVASMGYKNPRIQTLVTTH